MNKIAVKRVDGGVSIIIPTNEATPELLERDALAVDGYVSHREINDIDIPLDRYFRNAWTDDNPTMTVDVNMTKAADIHKDKLRIIRKPKLAALDVEYMKALETGDSALQSDIVAKKQALRDVTDDPNIAAAQTPEELKNVIPTILKE